MGSGPGSGPWGWGRVDGDEARAIWMGGGWAPLGGVWGGYVVIQTHKMSWLAPGGDRGEVNADRGWVGDRCKVGGGGVVVARLLGGFMQGWWVLVAGEALVSGGKEP